jgi:hypothetical protein
MNLLKQLKNFATDSSSSSGVPQNWYITAERAEGLKDKDTFSKSDPYLTIEFGGKSVRTRTINNDRSPAWNETFHFKLNSASVKDISLTLKDDDIGFDDLIGVATLSRAELPSFPGEEKSFKVPVYRKEQVGGVVHLRIKLMADPQSLSQTNYQTSNVPSSSYYSQQQPLPSQSQKTSAPPKQPYNQSYAPPINNPPYNQDQQQSYNQPQPQFYNQPQYPYNQPPSSYNQSQPPFYNQPQPQPQPPFYNQPQPPFYNQNQYPQQQTSSMMHPSFQTQPQPQQPNQFYPNYPNYQYERRQY